MNHSEIVSFLWGVAEGEHTKIFPTTHFGYRRITVERPLRLNFQASAERVARLDEESAFRGLAISKKKDATTKAAEETAGREAQDAIRAALRKMPATVWKDRSQFVTALAAVALSADLKLSAPVLKSILSALSERDETAEICRDSDAQPEPDSELRDTENVPLSESVEAYFDREVRPYVPDACIKETDRDEKDGEIGRVGYEINFNRYFCRYTPPRPFEEIQAEIRTLEKEIVEMLREVAG